MSRSDKRDALSVWAQRLVMLDSDETGKMKRALARNAQLVVFTIEQLLQDKCLERAAALTYKTVFSIVPLFAVAFSLFKAFNAFEGMEARVQDALFNRLLATPFVEESDETVVGTADRGRSDGTMAGMTAKSGAQMDDKERKEAAVELLKALDSGFDPSVARSTLMRLPFGKGEAFEHIRLSITALDGYRKKIELPELSTSEAAGDADDGERITKVKFDLRIVALRNEMKYGAAINLCLRAIQSGMRIDDVIPHMAAACRGVAKQYLDGQNWEMAQKTYEPAVGFLTDAIVLASSSGSSDVDLAGMAKEHDNALREWGESFLGRARAQYREYLALGYSGTLQDKVKPEHAEILEGALADLEEAASLMPDPSEIHALRADVLWELGRPDESRDAYKDALGSLRSAGATKLTRATVDYVRDYISRTSAAGIGVMGGILLVFSATWLLMTIEKNFNDIWHVTLKRAMFLRFASFATILLIGPVLIGLSIGISQGISYKLTTATGGIWALSRAVKIGGVIAAFVFPVLTLWVALLLAYKFIPHSKVSFKAAAWGAIIGAVGLQSAQSAFAFYVRGAVAKTEIYGSLGAVPFFLLWLYILWVIVLFGVEVTHTVENINNLRIRERTRVFAREMIDRSLLLRVAYYIGYDFHTGKSPSSIQMISLRLNLPQDTIERAIDCMADRKLLSYADEESGLVIPGRDLDEIRVADVIGIADAHALTMRSYEAADAPSENRLRQMISALTRNTRESLGDLTLRDLIAGAEQDNSAAAQA
ncbi:MAG TPA: YhjD/YihY/BrkB family envelope integrity protein [Candidatus Brocadiia bacterium]|nr:YhjD/YihY/BrkB family envelope integrity protein [Candidatus Brocadiia bacterium]